MQMEWGGVRDDGGGRPSADREAVVRSAISRWRGGLLDAAAANRLLTFGPGGAALIGGAPPGGGGGPHRLRGGRSFAFRSLTPWAGPAGAVPPPAPYLLDTRMEPDDLEAALGVLMRRSNQEALERGVPVLYLAFGTLTWADRDRARYASPLLLVPVRLVATEPEQPPMLEPTEDDPVINPALGLELARDRITLPRWDDLGQVALSGLLDRVRAAVAGHDGWLGSETAVLSCFPPMKAAMYRHLLDDEDRAAAHPAVRALAAGGRAGEEPALGGIAGDAAGAAGENPPVILDADSAQRACVMAALAGRSFTLNGPPGTGKSQTIANMIGALLHAGKTVLLVSEKAAALDVVAERLTGAGLGGYLLELHSDKATRKAVAASLASALDPVSAMPEAVQPGAAAVPAGDTAVQSGDIAVQSGDIAVRAGDTGAVRYQRAELMEYAYAVNRVRDPLGYSLHDVLAMIASLRT